MNLRRMTWGSRKAFRESGEPDRPKDSDHLTFDEYCEPGDLIIKGGGSFMMKTALIKPNPSDF